MVTNSEQIENINNQPIESYALFRNVDSTILQTNYFMENFGYRFQCIDLHDFENSFSSLFLLPKSLKSSEKLKLRRNNRVITKDFCNILMDDNLVGRQLLFEEQAILLKCINNTKLEVRDNHIGLGESAKVANDLREFVNNLIQQFRLLKNGDIDCILQFQISKESRDLTSKMYFGKSMQISKPNIFTLEKEEIKTFESRYSKTFKANSLTELAIKNFNLSYEINDVKTKYITLMTCLESLFNLGREQITHTVSRHLSLIISNSESDFQTNYRRVKELYGIRSSIVHGNIIKENLHEVTIELQDKTRQAINYCLTISGDKKQLFNKLNSFGFVEENKLEIKNNDFKKNNTGTANTHE